jgi:signal transduction histidine kinase/CheY-like chemotaxis protein
MPEPSSADRLRRCIRDLTAVTVLPSLCVGRTLDETLDILVDTLPSALGCELVWFELSDPTPQQRGTLHGAPLSPEHLGQMHAATATGDDGADATIFVAGERVWCMEAEIPLGAHRGRLLAGRSTPLDAETDRVLVRTAANVIGTIVATANVLDAARRKDDFLAMLGHELRNPLAPIMIATDLLRSNASAKRERDVIERHAQHLVRIVDDLLDISRVTRDHVELRREYVSLGSVMERAVEMVMPLVVRSHHQLHVEDANDIGLEGDPIRLTQIFGNLLTNAAKFTPAGGRIDVQIERLPARVRVTVQDTGRGIAADQLKRIFEPFMQADDHDLPRGGLGLGLAIVSSLAQRHGGSISVRSDGRGKGAAFTVELPTVAMVGRRSSVQSRPALERRADCRVLVVDDNTDIADLLCEALQAKGFQTAVANDGPDAVTSWRRFLPQAGVLDVGLPGMDGYDVARAIRAEHGSNVVLIAMTGYGQPSDRTRAVEAGFDCHLVKPVSIDDLVRALDQRVARPS